MTRRLLDRDIAGLHLASLGASLPILIRSLDEVKLLVGSNPRQFALAHDTLTRAIRSLEWDLIFSHLVDGSALAGKLFHV
jgi:hypothetical protein